MAEQETDKKGIIKALIFALLLAFLVIGVLGWQYRKIETEKVPALEEKIEQKIAESALDKFMYARIGRNEQVALNYLTEVAMEQKNSNGFSLLGDFKTYEILNQDKLSDDRYRFAVKIYDGGRMNDWVEVITLTKILDQYYIDSVEMGG
ncbi:MAG: hypothetical protein ABIG29_03460 [Candidatus Nealsonbacteria bacterium]